MVLTQIAIPSFTRTARGPTSTFKKTQTLFSETQNLQTLGYWITIETGLV